MKHMKLAVKKKKKQFRPSKAKSRELVLLTARRSEGDVRFGAVKLNKLLFYADFLAYLKLGNPITWQPYFALRQGPAPRRLVGIRAKMESDGEIAIRKRETFTGIQDRVLALREPDVTVFTTKELDLIEYVIRACWEKSSWHLSEVTHRFAGWKSAKLRETIPYSVALVGSRPPTQDEIKRGRDLESTASACLTRYASASA